MPPIPSYVSLLYLYYYYYYYYKGESNKERVTSLILLNFFQ